jgi:hypothetical protein
MRIADRPGPQIDQQSAGAPRALGAEHRVTLDHDLGGGSNDEVVVGDLHRSSVDPVGAVCPDGGMGGSLGPAGSDQDRR